MRRLPAQSYAQICATDIYLYWNVGNLRSTIARAIRYERHGATHAIGIAMTTSGRIAVEQAPPAPGVAGRGVPPGWAFARCGSLRGNNIVNARLYASRVRIAGRAILVARPDVRPPMSHPGSIIALPTFTRVARFALRIQSDILEAVRHH